MKKLGNIREKQILDADDLNFILDVLIEKRREELKELLFLFNRTNELHDYLEKNGLYEVIEEQRKTKIFVLGATRIPRWKIIQIARECGVNEHIDFWLEYNKNPGSVSQKLRKNELYKAIVMGALPHSTPGTKGHSSLLARMKAEPENYPKVYEARKQNGTLKFNESSLRRAFQKIKEDDMND